VHSKPIVSQAYRKFRHKVGNFFYDISNNIKIGVAKLFHKNIVDVDHLPDNVKKARRHREASKLSFVWIALFPALASLALWYFYMNFESFFLAFRVADASESSYTYGWDNFKWCFEEIQRYNVSTMDKVPPLGEALVNSLIYWAWNFFLIIPLCYLISYFIYKKIWGASFFRYVFFLPSVLPMVITSAIFYRMMQNNGPIAILVTAISGGDLLNQIDLLHTKGLALPTLLLYNLWGAFGVNMIYFTANLERIPKDIIESARIDGAGTWGEISHILFPITWPFFSTFLFLNLTSIFAYGGATLTFNLNGMYGTSDYPYWNYAMTNYSSLMGSWMYRCAAMGLITTIVSAPIAIIFHHLANKVEPVEY